MDMMYTFSKISAQDEKFKKVRHDFKNEGAMITTTLVTSCQWKTPATFCLRKKRPENDAFLTPSVNCHKIIQK